MWVEAGAHVVERRVQFDTARAAGRPVADHEHAVLVLHVDPLLDEQGVRVVLGVQELPAAPLLHPPFQQGGVVAFQSEDGQPLLPCRILDHE